MSNALTVIEPTNLTELKGVAEVFAASGLFKDTQGMAQAFVKMMAGRELGFGAFASMNGINIIQGKPAIGAGLMAAAIKKNPRYDYQIERLDNSGCVLVFFELRDGERVELGKSSFVEADATAAKLNTRDNWQKNPRNMFFARAISNGLRWYCPDVFMQSVYTVEEMGDDQHAEPAYDPETGEIYDGEVVSPVSDEDKSAPTPRQTQNSVPNFNGPSDRRIPAPDVPQVVSAPQIVNSEAAEATPADALASIPGVAELNATLSELDAAHLGADLYYLMPDDTVQAFAPSDRDGIDKALVAGAAGPFNSEAEAKSILSQGLRTEAAAQTLAAKTYPFSTEDKDKDWQEFIRTSKSCFKKFWPAVRGGLGYGKDSDHLIHEVFGVESMNDVTGRTVRDVWLELARNAPPQPVELPLAN